MICQDMVGQSPGSFKHFGHINNECDGLEQWVVSRYFTARKQHLEMVYIYTTVHKCNVLQKVTSQIQGCLRGDANEKVKNF